LAAGLIRYLAVLSFAHRGILSGFYILSVPRRLNVGAAPFFPDRPEEAVKKYIREQEDEDKRQDQLEMFKDG
jgi:hypothetical protein